MTRQSSTRDGGAQLGRQNAARLGRRYVARLGLRAAMVVAAVALLAIFRPWTTRPIASPVKAAFNATTYVQGIWPRVLAEAEAKAGAVAQTPGAGARFVSATGTVTRVDTASRVGLAHVRVGSGRDAADVALQVGPVLRGTALRDALDFIQFSDFANQSDFAAVGNALNDHVLQTVLPSTDLASLAGRTISFVGAARTRTEPTVTFIEVVPVVIRAGAGDR